MAAVRRAVGSGTVVALVVFIVVAFIAIGLSLWLYQQLSTVTRAVAQNQAEFEGAVGKMFREHGWELTADSSPEFSIKYQQEAYGEVKAKLNDAATYEELLEPLLGWNSVEGVKTKLTREGSPVQSVMTEPYRTIKGLLEEYEDRYLRLTERVRKLEGDLASAKKLAAERETAADRRYKEQLTKNNEASARHTVAIQGASKQFKVMNDMYTEAWAEAKDWQQKYEAAQKQWGLAEAELLAQAMSWKELYERERTGELEGETMQAAGKVLQVDSGYEFVMLEGGKDVERERNTTMVVYSQTRLGDQTKKGELLISMVADRTSLALIQRRERDEHLLPGDLYVPRQVWDKFHPLRIEEPLIVRVVTPTWLPAEGVIEEEEEPEEEEDIFIFEGEEEEEEEEEEEFEFEFEWE